MLQIIRLVLERLREAGLKLKPEKCNLFKTETKFLGHVISEKGITTDPEKIDAVKHWPTLTCAKDIHSFLGSSYYRRFIKSFAQIAKSLYQLINLKPKQFKWEQRHEEAFSTLKQQLTGNNILTYPNYTPPPGKFVVDTDSSDEAIGGVLSQYDSQGLLRPIAYGSKTL